MCVVIFDWQPGTSVPLRLGANRDELRRRPWEPPAWRPGAVPILCPLDLEAGGTWLGLNARGLCVALTNRDEAALSAGLSRGILVRELLGTESHAAAEARLGSLLQEHRFSPFNLLIADAEAVSVHRHGAGSDERRKPGPGVHVLTNRHDLDPALLAPVREDIEEARSRGPFALEDAIFARLRDHRSWDETDYAICKHGEGYGTLSSAWIRLGEEARMAFCTGPPCQGAFAPCPRRPEAGS
ncbi:MAG: NRDE family protein [Planctomycetota bacterium]